MRKHLYQRMLGWHVMVEEHTRGIWEAYAVPVPVEGASIQGELVPGGPFATVDQAGDRGVAYVKSKGRR